jgi:hypothetical protein
MGAQFALNVLLAQKTLWAYSTVLLGDVGLVEACFSLFGDSISLSTT